MKTSEKNKQDIDFDKVITSVKEKFGILLVHEKDGGLIYPRELTGEEVAEIQQYIKETL
jgi:hypothetical protein